MGTTTIFCESDEFCKEFEPRLGTVLIRVVAETASAARSAVSKRSDDHHGGVSSIRLPGRLSTIT